MAAKYTSDESDEIDKLASGVSQISLPVTVLSWNIYGKTTKGMAEARKIMLKNTIGDIKPDVMLLQETINSIDKFFSDTGIPKEDYNYEEAQNNKEARIIYKTSAFEEVKKCNVDTILAKVFPESETRETKSGKVHGRQTIKDRLCVVHLRHKQSGGEIIFVSYHNINKGKQSDIMASKVCKIIADLHDSSSCCVIAGVDFNSKDFEREDVEVPNYEVTPRRSEEDKIDYFIVSKSTVNWEVESVKSFDLFPKDTSIYKKLQSFIASFVWEDQYEEALDHDPLVLSLTVVKRGEEKE